MGKLSGKVAIVTGATQGIGETIARSFVKEGAQVVITGRSVDKGNHVVNALRDLPGCQGAIYLEQDVTVKARAAEIVAETLEAFGRIDILVNNAQIITQWEAVETPTADESMDISLLSGVFASLWMSQAVFPHMRDQGGGRIINCGSIGGVIGLNYQGPYGASKEAIRGLTRHLANEWGRHNITVNAYIPAGRSPNYENLTATRASIIESTPELAAQKRKMDVTSNYQPLLLGTDEGMGAAIVGIASDDARFLTGQSFFTDGGLHLWAVNHHLNIAGSYFQHPDSYRQTAGLRARAPQ